MPGPHAKYPGKIRIIGGAWRSRIIDIAANPALRPTPDRVRETVFNWLQPYIAGAHCIDLFAGSGALCFEALSRGAASATLVESDAPTAELLRANKQKLNATGAEIVHMDALDYLRLPPRPFDIIFLDPPFKSHYIKKCAAALTEGGWLGKDTFVYIEAPKDMRPLPLPASWTLLKDKIAGEVGYSLARAAI